MASAVAERRNPSDFLKQITGRFVVVKLHSGSDYRGVLKCLDGYMNIVLEQTEEYINGEFKRKYGDAFIRDLILSTDEGVSEVNIMNAQLARIFSGIQPTGVPHLGNYFGALVQWSRLAQDRVCEHESKSIKCDVPVYSIVDVHAYSSLSTQFGAQLYEQILSTTASLLAIGLNQDNSIVFRQSDLFEHNYLDNVLDSFVSTQRLKHMIQFKEKTANAASQKSTPNALLNYPILQAADILLYRSNLVPIGDDQLQHIELARDIARKFNSATTSELFPEPRGLLNQSRHARRVKSLRDPSKKMSKSDPDKKAFIEIVDKPENIREKIKKSLTDSISSVYYDPELRPGVSNLMRIHHLVTGESFEQIRDQNAGIESAQYKLILADILIEHFKPIRREYLRVRNERNYLEQVLSQGKSRAEPLAQATVNKVRHVLGSIRLDKV